MRPQFRDWFVSSDFYPADQLYFFGGAQLVLDAEPSELAILFYELTPSRRDLLSWLEPDAERGLNFSRNWVGTTSSVWAPGARDERPHDQPSDFQELLPPSQRDPWG
jgi:hypothetical protein